MAKFASLWAFLVLFITAISSPLGAHEIRPAIADVAVSGERVDIKIVLPLEAFVANMDLQGLTDTNESPLSQQYDFFREMSPEDLERAFRERWPAIAANFHLRAGNLPLAPEIVDIEIPPVGNASLPRDSTLFLTAPLPPDNSNVTFGWSASYGPLIVRQFVEGSDGYAGYLTNGAISDELPRVGAASQSWGEAFINYVILGFEHIVPKGMDHILFVLGLFFFSLKMRPLLTQVTAFTLAHTVALALGVLGLVNVPASIVEPLIAASIVYVAVENIFHARYRPWRTGVVFLFGLLHGLGFASVLGDIGLQTGRFVTGLIGFNIGVELGQLTVILTAFVILGLPFGKKDWYRQIITIPASAAIAVVGFIWFLQRTVL